MTRLFPKILPFIVLSFLVSCLRTDQYNLEETTPRTTNQESKLIAIYTQDSSLPAGRDTTYIQRFYYDATDRIVAVTGTNKQAGSDSFHLQYFYNGSDTLANRIISYERYTGPMNGIVLDTVYLRYQNGRLVSDSSVSGNGPGSTAFSQWVNYVYSGNSVFTYRQNSYSPPLTAADTAIEGLFNTAVVVNGNTVAESSDSATYNPQTGIFRRTGSYATFTATYDVHSNPVFRIGRSYQVPIIPIEYFVDIYTDGAIPRNLPIETKHTSNVYPGGVIQTSNTYVFRSDGLPTSRTMRFFEQGTWTNWETAHYLYQ
ncbi:MAG: hypothetical protein EOO15_07235 [Chitinophagaceae bacterium]|nr:MAG: hypothetical protein EOO15_07235 [Chitinophagaceae bacterium]